jgi:hypothetical protein
MKRLIVLGAVLSAALLPTVASAAKPVKEFLPAEPVVVDDVCEFPVELDPTINKEYIKSFFDNEGNLVREIVTGRFVNRLTNLETGESITVNVSGPVFFTYTEDTLTVRLTGRSLLYFMPGELTTGETYVRVTNGPNIFEVDLATGAITPQRQATNYVDVCEALA